MLVKNPLDKEVSLNHKGEVYYIDADKTVDFPEEIARQWVTIYQFMTISSSDIVKQSTLVEKTETIKEEKETKKK